MGRSRGSVLSASRGPDSCYNDSSAALGLQELAGGYENRAVVGKMTQQQQVSTPRRASVREPLVQRSSKDKSRPVAKKSIKTATPPKRSVRRKSKTHDLRATAAPLLVTVGVLLLIPAVWAVLLLMGVGVPGAEREDSRPMATVMLLSWPIAICLIATSIVFFLQVMREKKRLAPE